MPHSVESFPIHVPQAQLDDLAERLAQTRWPDPQTVSDHSQGPQLQRLRALVEHWQNAYDWRITETQLNEWNSSRTEIDGLAYTFCIFAPRTPTPFPC